MFVFTESVEVEADSQTVWSVMVDVEHWWAPARIQITSCWSSRIQGR